MAGLCLLGTAPQVQAQETRGKIFPYPYEMKDLDNGLRVIVIPTDYPNLVSLQIPVATGSRNEVEPGKSGFAHFFEHMMFRGTEKYPAELRLDILKNVGANQTAYTTDDYTNYHITFSKEDLETVLEFEADRFMNLKYSVEDFKTEARAVLGEYNKDSAEPVYKLLERQRDLAFKVHTYKHTVMGFIEDVEAMPDQFDYSLEFFDRYYRPEYTTIIVAGDVEPQHVFQLVEKYWGDWERGSYEAQIPEEPAPDGPLYDHVNWETPTLPWITIAFRGPAFSDETLDRAVLDMIAGAAFIPSSELYEKLVMKEQKVLALWPYFPYQKDPFPLSIMAQVKDPADVWYVRDQIMQTLAGLRTEPLSTSRLQDVKSLIRYVFALRMDNSEAIAEVLPPLIALTRDPETINRMYDRIEEVTPATIQEVANRYFNDQGMVMVTLSHGALPEEARPTGSVDALVEANRKAAPAYEKLVLRSGSPIVNISFLFNTGAADDPEGKEGLANLTARMVTEAGSREHTYEELEKKLIPMASGFFAQVDKEMTVFAGTTHLDNLSAYYDLISGQLFDPGWRESDFSRIKDHLINEIRIALRSNNEEELGKEVLYEAIYRDHPYGHLNAGHVEALQNITLDDVKEFYRTHYTRANLVVGLAGNVPEALERQIGRDVARLQEGTAVKKDLPQPKTIEGLNVTIVEKDTRATAISFGFPIDVNRSHKDFAALWLIRSYLGEHRAGTGRLFQRIREVRGLNYGDYAYIEYFPNGMFQFHPEPYLGRQQQIFQVWIRPVFPENSHFALRVALYELDKLIEQGMSREDFEATRNFLLKYVNVFTKSQYQQLGYALDSRFYGIGTFADEVKKGLESLTLEEVNRVLREHLDRDGIHVVIVTADAQDLRDRLVSNAPSPIQYDAPKPQEILDEDRIIQNYPLDIRPEKVRIIPVDQVFENGLSM